MRLRGLRAALHLPQATARPSSPTPLAIPYGCAPPAYHSSRHDRVESQVFDRDTAPSHLGAIAVVFLSAAAQLSTTLLQPARPQGRALRARTHPFP